MNIIMIEAGGVKTEVAVEFFDNPTSRKIQDSLPVTSEVNTWGDEIYFDTGISAPVHDATLDLNVGDIAYWPSGKCLCIFFGRTPASTGEKPAPASEVVVIGRTLESPDNLRKIPAGAKILIT